LRVRDNLRRLPELHDLWKVAHHHGRKLFAIDLAGDLYLAKILDFLPPASEVFEFADLVFELFVPSAGLTQTAQHFASFFGPSGAGEDGTDHDFEPALLGLCELGPQTLQTGGDIRLDVIRPRLERERAENCVPVRGARLGCAQSVTHVLGRDMPSEMEVCTEPGKQDLGPGFVERISCEGGLRGVVRSLEIASAEVNGAQQVPRVGPGVVL